MLYDAFVMAAVPANSDIRLISVTKPRSPPRNLTCSRLEVLWITACTLSAVAFGAAPASRLLCGYGRPLLFRALPEGRPTRRTRKPQRRNGPPSWTGPGGWSPPPGAARRLKALSSASQDEAVEVIADALVRNDTSVAEWIVERAVVRHSKPGDPPEKSARMRDEDARARTRA